METPMKPEDYIKSRVEDQLGFYERAANRNKNIHLRMQTTIIVFGLLVPVVANLQMDYPSGADIKTITITVLSLALACLTGLANFRKYGDLWLAFRTTEELLKKELFLFRTQSGPYKDNATAFSRFVQAIEATISVEHERFRSLIESSQRPTTGPSSSGEKA